MSDGKMLIAETGKNRLNFLNSSGKRDYYFGKKGNKNGEFNSLQGVVSNDEGFIYIADTKNNRIQIFNNDGIYLDSFGKKSQDIGEEPEEGSFNQPQALIFDSNNQLYVLDTKNKRVQIFVNLKNFADSGKEIIEYCAIEFDTC